MAQLVDSSGTVVFTGRIDGLAVYQSTVQISSAELLALDATPKVLLPAPPGRFYYVVHAVVLHYRFATGPYSGDFLPAFGYGAAVADIDPSSGVGAAFGIAKAYNAGSAIGQSGPTLLQQTTDAYLYVVGPQLQVAQQWSAWLAGDIENLPFVVANFPLVPLSSGPVAAHLTDGATTITYTAQTAGAAGNAITIRLVAAGLNVPATTSAAVGSAITVTLSTDGGGASTATAQDVVDAIANDGPSALLVAAAATVPGAGASNYGPNNLGGGSDGGGTGTVTARVFYTSINGAP